ncbi:MAG: SpoIIIAH-like family protein [Bacteroidales bacterium]|nr:SpoIIIAH-like family protein [Anaerotignum sp.]MCI5678813.1 SpoIIIAH-like family protein [Bacteroidales bacterium]MDY3926823.1 SpoIIIAH-like family protein [Anaerotignum sp.]
MFVIKRNQVVVTALAVMIAAAGYLNFQESRSSEGNQTALQLTEEGDVTALVDYSALPDDVDTSALELDPITAEVAETTGDGAAIYVSASGMTGSEYFAEAKLDREQSRSKQKDILTEMLNNENISQEQKDKCSENMMQLQERIEKETAAEAMIESKGFKEAYVRIDDDTVDVVVDKDTLTDAEVAQIEDIVKRKTGMEPSKIRINTLQKAK